MKAKGQYEFWWGIAFLLLGILCCLTFWLGYFGLFFISVGTILILLSKQGWYLQVLTIFPPFVFVVYIILSFFPIAEKYYIPDGFTGIVYIVYDEKHGEEKAYEGLMKVYNIPNTGVLFTKFKQKDGIHNRHFYYVNRNNQMKELGILDYRNYNDESTINPSPNEPSRDSLAVFTPETRFDSNKNQKFCYTAFTIGKYRNTKSWNWLPPEFVDSLRKTHSLEYLRNPK